MTGADMPEHYFPHGLVLPAGCYDPDSAEPEDRGYAPASASARVLAVCHKDATPSEDIASPPRDQGIVQSECFTATIGGRQPFGNIALPVNHSNRLRGGLEGSVSSANASSQASYNRSSADVATSASDDVAGDCGPAGGSGPAVADAAGHQPAH